MPRQPPRSALPRAGPRGYFARMQPPPPTADSARPAGRGLPVWLPWVLAPAFLLLPVGGCGVAASLRRPQATTLAAKPPSGVPVGTVVTIAVPNQTVAWRSTAN
jgi:hypothetical protein